MFSCEDIFGDVPKALFVKGLINTQKTLQREGL